MSSTNRGLEREADDTYFTRYPCARACVDRLVRDGIVVSPDRRKPVRILEPSCGRGAFVRAIADAGIYPSVSIDALDVSPKLLLPEHAEHASRIITSDFLDYTPRLPYDAVIGNPPYSHAEQHVVHALSIVRDQGVVAFLLRLNFLSGLERHGWDPITKQYVVGFYDRFPPAYLYPLDKRPRFKEGSKTDSCEYAIFVWIRGGALEDEVADIVTRPLRWRNYMERYAMTVEKLPPPPPKDKAPKKPSKKAAKKPRKKKAAKKK